MAIDPVENQRIELRKTFDGEALRYQRARPGYPREIFDLIADAGDLGPTSRVLEVGAGTGQATRSMATRVGGSPPLSWESPWLRSDGRRWLSTTTLSS